MSDSDSTPIPSSGNPADTRETPATSKTTKPSKPYPDFPLFPHATRRWAKKIRGQLHYFGPWSDPDGALKRYNEQKADLHAGRTPRADPESLTIRALVNAFLNEKKSLVDNGDLSPRTWDDYKTTCDVLVSRFGKGRLVGDLAPADFTTLRAYMAKRWGITRLSNTIQRVRSVFKYAFDADMIDRPIRFGPGFKRPSQKTKRIERARRGPKLFTADEIRRMIGTAGQPLKTMILLGINAGFGNADCGTLPMSAVDLDAGMIDYPRPKTGMPRRCALWTETTAALQEAISQRPVPKDPAGAALVFVTKYGLSWAKDTSDNPITKETAKLLKALAINGRNGIGFYSLRHTFRTVADEAKDQPAADFIMGHEVSHMSSVYRETISDARLKAVSDHVRKWLFPSVENAKPAVDPKDE